MQCKPKRKTPLAIGRALTELLAVSKLHTKALKHLDKIGHKLMSRADDMQRELQETKTEFGETKTLVLEKLAAFSQEIADLKAQLSEAPANQATIDTAITELDQMQKDHDELQANIKGEATEPNVPPTE